MSNFTIIKFITCVSGLCLLIPNSNLDTRIYIKNTPIDQPLTRLSPAQVKQQATDITVKILSTEFLGSGILLKKNGNIYTILTNAHVLEAGQRPYNI